MRFLRSTHMPSFWSKKLLNIEFSKDRLMIGISPSIFKPHYSSSSESDQKVLSSPWLNDMSRSYARVKLFIKFIDSPYEYRVFTVTFAKHQWTSDLYSANDDESRTICQNSVCEKQLNFFKYLRFDVDWFVKAVSLKQKNNVWWLAGAVLGGLFWMLTIWMSICLAEFRLRLWSLFSRYICPSCNFNLREWCPLAPNI